MRARALLYGLIALTFALASPAWAQSQSGGDGFSSTQSGGSGSSSGNHTSNGGTASDGHSSSTSESSGFSSSSSGTSRQTNNDGHASASQVGDTDARFEQHTKAESGDSHSGSQINRIGGAATQERPDLELPEGGGGGASANSGEVDARPGTGHSQGIADQHGDFSQQQGEGSVPEHLVSESAATQLPTPDTASWVMIAIMLFGLLFVFLRLPKPSAK